MSAGASSQSIVLCEGYDDRAFWAGWLRFLGWDIPERFGNEELRFKVEDPIGKRITGGQFGFYRNSEFVRIIPCRGKSKILPEFRIRMRERELDPVLARLVVSLDPDITAGAKENTTGLRAEDVLREARAFDPMADLKDWQIVCDGGKTIIGLIRWETADVQAPGLPAIQTLERLVCCSIAAAYPGRGDCVHSWLNSCGIQMPAGPKEHAWSYMAGWHADEGCDRFYQALWKDAAVRTELERRLRANGAWSIVESLGS